VEPESSDDEEFDLIRVSLVEMSQGDGWHYFRRFLQMKREEQMKRMLAILPNDASPPLYADARAKIQLLDDLLASKPGDILDVIREYTNE
jgi:hypothetical protein